MKNAYFFFASDERPSERASRGWSGQSMETSITERPQEPRARL